MAERRYQPAVLDVDLMTDTELERREIFTPDDEYYTPPAAATATTTQSSSHSQNEYEPRTLKTFNQTRKNVLPIFPLRSALKQMIPDYTDMNEEIDLLLCNVPSKR